MANVIYDGNGNTGGTVPATLSYAVGATVPLAPDTTFVRENFIFKWWSDSPTGNGINYGVYGDENFTILRDINFTMPSHDVTLYALWKRIFPSITYHLNFGTDVLPPKVYDPGVITLSDIGEFISGRLGNTFTSWNTNADGTGTNYPQLQGIPTSFTMPLSNVDLYAQWTISAYIVTIYPNYPSDIVGTMLIPEVLAIPFSQTNLVLFTTGFINSVPPYQYVVTSATTNSDGSGLAYYPYHNNDSNGNNPITILNPQKDISFYIQWSKLLKIVYSGNGSTSGDMSYIDSYAYSKGYSTSKVLAHNLYTKTGYLFSCWCTSADGLGVRYLEGTYLITDDTDITLYAIWQVCYTITFSDNNSTTGSENVPAPIYYLGGALQTLTMPGEVITILKTNFKQIGWNTAADGSGLRLVLNSTIELKETNLTLYIEWSSAYGIVYVDNCNFYTYGITASSIPPYVVTDTKSIFFVLPSTNIFITNPVTTGYLSLISSSVIDFARGRFVNWNTAADGSGTTYNLGDSINIYRDIITLYAQWIITPRITFHGTSDVTKQFEIGDTYIFTDSSQVLGIGNGSFFTHWNTSADGSGTTYNIGDSITLTANTYLIVYAQMLQGYLLYLFSSHPFNYNTNIHSPYLGTIFSGDSLGISEGQYCSVISLQKDSTFIITDALKGTLSNTSFYISSWNTKADGSGTTYVDGTSFLVDGSAANLYGTYFRDDSGESFYLGGSYVLYAQWSYSPKVYYYIDNTGYLGTFLYNTVKNPNSTFYGFYLRGDYSTRVIHGSYASAEEAQQASWITDPPYFMSSDGSGTYGIWYYAVDPLYPNDPLKVNFFTLTGFSSSLIAYLEWQIKVKRVPECARGIPGTTFTVASDVIDANNTMGRANSVFIDWSGSSTDNLVVYAPGSEMVYGVQDIILYAHFRYLSSVVYNTTNATGGLSPILEAHNVGDTVTSPSCNLYRTHYSFGGWTLVIESNNPTPYDGVVLKVGDTFIMPERLNGDVILNPVWIALPLLTYFNNGNTMELPIFDSHVAGSTVTVDYIGTTLNSITSSKFSHWTTDIYGGTSYVKGDTFIMPSSDVNLYAIWVKEVAISFIYTYDEIDTESVLTGSSINLDVKINNLGNSEFNYWCNNLDGTGTRYPKGYQFIANEDTSFYAIWKPLTVVASTDLYTIYLKPR